MTILGRLTIVPHDYAVALLRVEAGTGAGVLDALEAIPAVAVKQGPAPPTVERGSVDPAPIAQASVERLFELAATDMAAVDELIRDRLQSPVALIPALAEHLISAGGKRLRPLLTVAAGRLCGARGDGHLKLAASVEFIHTATLLHDDVVDGSSLRRGKTAAHLIWGGTSSVLVGDFLFARAFELMVETGSLRSLQILAQASRVIAEGEVLQLTRAHDLNLNQDTYLEIIRGKTAELFAAAAEAGAVVSGVSDRKVAALNDYGLKLGLAFQLTDDALDYGGASEVLGKNAGDDFREGKVTLPLLLAIERTRASERGFWERVIDRRDQADGDFARAFALIVQSGALAATLDLAQRYAEEAKAALEVFEPSDWRASLEALADFAVSRAA